MSDDEPFGVEVECRGPHVKVAAVLEAVEETIQDRTACQYDLTLSLEEVDDE